MTALARRLLAVDTTSEFGSIAISEGSRVIEEVAIESPEGFGHVLFDEIVRLLAQGHSVRRISELLCLNYKTVANYQSAIRQKLRVESAIDLIRVATRSGMVVAGNDVPS